MILKVCSSLPVVRRLPRPASRVGPRTLDSVFDLARKMGVLPPVTAPAARRAAQFYFPRRTVSARLETALRAQRAREIPDRAFARRKAVQVSRSRRSCPMVGKVVGHFKIEVRERVKAKSGE